MYQPVVGQKLSVKQYTVHFTLRACDNKTLIGSTPSSACSGAVIERQSCLYLEKERPLRWTRDTTKRPSSVVRKQRETPCRLYAVWERDGKVYVNLKSISETTRDSGRHTKKEAKEHTSSYATTVHHAASDAHGLPPQRKDNHSAPAPLGAPRLWPPA